jgi:type VI secretion system protein ImpM
MPEAPGFYGKAPSRGDFLSRRISNSFVSEWDIWLQSIVTASKALLGDDWLPAWLEAPVWHFALGSTIAGPAPAIGVLIPSVDRVGRHFPFSILGECQAGGMARDLWAPRAETLALSALEDGFDPARLASELTSLGPPATEASGHETPPHGWSTPRAPHWHNAESGETIWWCRDTPRVAAATLRAEGLPALTDAACLVAGRPTH